MFNVNLIFGIIFPSVIPYIKHTCTYAQNFQNDLKIPFSNHNYKSQQKCGFTSLTNSKNSMFNA